VAQRTARAGPSKVARIPSPVDLNDPSPVVRHEAVHRLVVRVEGSPPGVVAGGGELFGGGHDVGEQHGRQDSIRGRGGLGFVQKAFDLGEGGGRVTEEDGVFGARQLNEPRARDLACEFSTSHNVRDTVLAAMEHQCRYSDRREHRSVVELTRRFDVLCLSFGGVR
jgi:hypothetical protein